MDLEKLKYEKQQKNEMNFINADKNVTSINSHERKQSYNGNLPDQVQL